MKYLKQKLMAAAAMVMVATVMLSSASYAWFTISTAPEVTNITTTVTANENLEIALATTVGENATQPSATTTGDSVLATGKDHTWGATITSLNGLTGLGPATVAVDGSAVQTVTYGTDGRPSGLVGVDVVTAETSVANGKNTIKDKNGNVIGQKIYLWIRTNTTGNITATISGIKIGTSAADTNATATNEITVAMKMGSEKIIQATAGDTVGTATISLGELEASDSGTMIEMYIYMDGTLVTNLDAATAATAIIEKIEFTNSNIEEHGTTGAATYNPNTVTQ